jgi:hypothetical protein
MEREREREREMGRMREEFKKNEPFIITKPSVCFE